MTLARDQHRRLDRDFAEADARDGGADGQPELVRPRRWRTDTVSGNRPREPKVLLLQLSERTSGTGTRYFSGWLGKARLVGFLADEPDRDGNPLWNVYAAEPQLKAGR